MEGQIALPSWAYSLTNNGDHSQLEVTSTQILHSPWKEAAHSHTAKHHQNIQAACVCVCMHAYVRVWALSIPVNGSDSVCFWVCACMCELSEWKILPMVLMEQFSHTPTHKRDASNSSSCSPGRLHTTPLSHTQHCAKEQAAICGLLLLEAWRTTLFSSDELEEILVGIGSRNYGGLLS